MEHHRMNSYGWFYICIAVVASAKKPNILLLHADDMSPFISPWISDSHPMHGMTPNLDRLVKTGTSFTKAYAQQAVCGPSRHSFLSGRYPETLQLFSFDNFLPEKHPNMLTIPKYFKETLGYYTLALGKVFHPQFTNNILADDIYFQTGHFSRLTNAFDQRGNSECPRNQLYCSISGITLTDEKIANQAGRFFRSHESVTKGKPWLMIIGLRRPHTGMASKPWTYRKIPFSKVRNQDQPPLEVPDIEGVDDFRESLSNFECRKLEMYRAQTRQGNALFYKIDKVEQLTKNVHATARIRQAYYANLIWVDFIVGRILDDLEAAGLRNNTIIVFFSDHGWANGEQNMWCKNSLYPSSLAVPMIVSLPWRRETVNKISETPTQLIDIFPTLIDLVDGPEFSDGSGHMLDGVSLVPSLNSADKHHHAASYSQYPRCVCNSDLGECPPSNFRSSVRSPVNVQFHPCTTHQNMFDKGTDCLRPKIAYMGYTINTPDYRYIEWRKYVEKIDGCSTWKRDTPVPRIVESYTLWDEAPFQKELYSIDKQQSWNKWTLRNLAVDSNPFNEQVMRDLSRMIEMKFRLKETICNNVGLLRNYGTLKEQCDYDGSGYGSTKSPTRRLTSSPSPFMSNRDCLVLPKEECLKIDTCLWRDSNKKCQQNLCFSGSVAQALEHCEKLGRTLCTLSSLKLNSRCLLSTQKYHTWTKTMCQSNKGLLTYLAATSEVVCRSDFDQPRNYACC